MNFKKRVNGSWHDTPYYIHNTATDMLTTLPAVVYPTGTTATVGLKGNVLQSSTPSPTSPVMPQGTGDLETSGAKAGQYKIPISSANTTTNIYLGEVQTTRKVKKLVLTGEEDITSTHLDVGLFNIPVAGYLRLLDKVTCICTHYIGADNVRGWSAVSDKTACFYAFTSASEILYIRDSTYNTIDSFKSYLAQQYANGTPVTVWFVLDEPETGVVNEPLRKIGDYADEVSGITIPTAAGANTISVDTSLQPSEVSVNYKGWHPITDVHEHTNGAWT